MRARRLFEIAFAVMLVSIGASATEQSLPNGGPSFDCGNARTISEGLICADPELSDLDKSMARDYRKAKAVAADPAQLIQDQQQAVRWRQMNCMTSACLFEWYKSRAHVMVQILLNAPQSACAPLYDETAEQSRQRFYRILGRFSERHRETVEQFFERAHESDRTKVMAFAIAAESCGASVDDALESLQSMAEKLQQ